MDQDYISSLFDAYKYLDCLSKYDDLIDKYSNNTAQHKQKYYDLKNRHENSGFKPWLIYVFLLPMIFVTCSILIAGEMSNVIRVVICILLIILLIAPIFISKLSYKNEKRKNKQFEKEAIDYWQKIGGPAEKTNSEVISRINNEKREIIRKYSFVVDVIPPDYRNVTACGFIVSAMVNKRADNIKEAINLYEEALHRMRLESATQDLISAISSMQNEVMYQMTTINSNIDRTNSRLRDIENLEFYNTFFK